MEPEHRISLIGFSLTVVLLLTSCHSVGARRVHGPPAHAPAYGHRYKHVHGYDLVYDSSCGFYVVTGLSHHYYHDGHFYRLYDDVWEISVRGVAWQPLGYDALPSPLKVKFKPAVPGPNLNAVVKNPGPVKAVVKAPDPINPVLKTSGPANVKVRGKAKGRGKGAR